jgi:hypothetical protein
MTLEHTNFKKFEVHGGGGLHLSSSSWVAGGHYADVNDGGRWSGSGVEEPGHARDRGGTDQGVEDGRGVEAAARRLDRTRVGATGWPGRGGAQGGTGCRGGDDVEEPATSGCRRIGTVGGQA